jgi:hypothetical protein
MDGLASRVVIGVTVVFKGFEASPSILQFIIQPAINAIAADKQVISK